MAHLRAHVPRQRFDSGNTAQRRQDTRHNGNESVEAQLLNLLQQSQGQLSNQPALIDISQEEIICWDPQKKEKSAVTKDQFEEAAEVALDTEAGLAVAEIFQAGYLEICGLVYCLTSRGLPMKYL